MQFAINYSNEAALLIKQGHIEIDLFKCPDWDDLVADASQQRPVYVHFPLELGRGQTVDDDLLRRINNWLEQTGTRYVNTHLLPRAKTYPPGIDHDGVVDALIRECEPFVQRFGADRFIVENIPYHDGEKAKGTLPHAADPTVITDLLEATGAGLLLDVGHAALTCEDNAEYTFDSYLDALPTHRLREIHITGLGYNPVKQRRTDHLPMEDDDWARIETVVAHVQSGDWAQPYVMAFEYGGIGEKFAWRSEASVMAEQVPRLYALAHSTNNTSQPS